MPLERAAPEIVVVSHNHRDHLNDPTIERIGPEALFRPLGPSSASDVAKHVVEMEWWQTEAIGKRSAEGE